MSVSTAMQHITLKLVASTTEIPYHAILSVSASGAEGGAKDGGGETSLSQRSWWFQVRVGLLDFLPVESLRG